MADALRGKATLFVGGLSPQVTESVLYEAFVPFGPIVDRSLPRPELPSSKEPHRGFGYVEFENAEDAREAIDNMDQSELFGRVIKVNVAKEKRAEGEGLGSRTAVWEQVGSPNRRPQGLKLTSDPGGPSCKVCCGCDRSR